MLGIAKPACHIRHMGLRQDLFVSRKPLMGFIAIGVAWSIYFAQMPVIKAQVGASDAAYGIALLFSSLGAIAAMWLAPASQRWAGGYATPLGIVGVAVGMLWAGVSPSLVSLSVAMLVTSMGTGIVDVLVNARVSEVEAQTGRPLMNLNHAAYSFSYAGAAMLTGLLRNAELGPAVIMSGLFGFLMILTVLAYDHPAEVDGAEKETPGKLPVLLIVLTGVVLLVGILTEAATEGWSALHLERTLGGTAVEGAMGPAILGLTMGIGRIMGHWVSHYLRDTTLMICAALVAAVGVTIAASAPTVTVAHVGFAVAGLGISVVFPLAIALIGRVVDPEIRLAAISRAAVIGYGAFFFGPPLMGLVAEGFGLRAAFYAIAGILVMVAAVLVPALARQARITQAR